MMNVKIGENIKLKMVDYSFEIPINEDGVENSADQPEFLIQGREA